jgi:hypothetical protein
MSDGKFVGDLLRLKRFFLLPPLPEGHLVFVRLVTSDQHNSELTKCIEPLYENNIVITKQ